MKSFLFILASLTGISLVVAVLLHSAKGDGMGGIGAPAKMFNSQRGLEAGLNKVTSGLAAAFLLLSLLLALM
ncbi:MAG: preprotein translocase subunit SecG [Candidatus Margulisiibacteriota bacterium]